MPSRESIVEDELVEQRRQVQIRMQRRAGWISFFVRAAAAKEIAQNIPEASLSAQLTASAESAITKAIDEYCGTGTGSPSLRPHPGPPPGIYSLAAQLAIIANTFSVGALRSELIGIAASLTQRAVASPFRKHSEHSREVPTS